MPWFPAPAVSATVNSSPTFTWASATLVLSVWLPPVETEVAFAGSGVPPVIVSLNESSFKPPTHTFFSETL